MYICYLITFRDRNGNTSSDLCRKLGARGMTTASLEEAHSYGKHILKDNPDDIVDYQIWKEVDENGGDIKL